VWLGFYRRSDRVRIFWFPERDIWQLLVGLRIEASRGGRGQIGAFLVGYNVEWTVGLHGGSMGGLINAVLIRLLNSLRLVSCPRN
jgi:hypothetical protein